MSLSGLRSRLTLGSFEQDVAEAAAAKAGHAAFAGVRDGVGGGGRGVLPVHRDEGREQRFVHVQPRVSLERALDEGWHRLTSTDRRCGIAARAGLGDASTLRRCFTRQLGVTPEAYRARFAA